VTPLPLQPPLQPQLARPRKALPDEADGWAFEPKWDGFRAIAFLGGAAPDGEDPLEVYVQSRGGKALHRYFPEITFPDGLRAIIDGELIIDSADPDVQTFDTLSQRIHPAASRIERLAKETPARFVAFDLLCAGDEVLLDRPYEERRALLEAWVAEHDPAAAGHPFALTPIALTAADAEHWLDHAEGVIAKQLAAPYSPGKRDGMVKVKRVRTLDAVVVGWRPGKAAGTVGSIILGVYTPDGDLRVVGHSSGFSAKEKVALVDKLKPYETGERGMGDPSRWKPDDELEWVALRPELVVEVTYDHASDGRIRHGTKVQRWRDDKAPRECLVDQLDA
jgi:ATP-dependent DNA ligase